MKTKHLTQLLGKARKDVELYLPLFLVLAVGHFFSRICCFLPLPLLPFPNLCPVPSLSLPVLLPLLPAVTNSTVESFRLWLWNSCNYECPISCSKHTDVTSASVERPDLHWPQKPRVSHFPGPLTAPGIAPSPELPGAQPLTPDGEAFLPGAPGAAGPAPSPARGTAVPCTPLPEPAGPQGTGGPAKVPGPRGVARLLRCRSASAPCRPRAV